MHAPLLPSQQLCEVGQVEIWSLAHCHLGLSGEMSLGIPSSSLTFFTTSSSQKKLTYFKK